MTEELDPKLFGLGFEDVKPGSLPCRNCQVVTPPKNLHQVMGYRFCDTCYTRMKEIGQIVHDWRDKTRYKELLLWEGDPFNRQKKRDDPYYHMRPPKAMWD